MACSERTAKTRPFRVLIVARQNRSNAIAPFPKFAIRRSTPRASFGK
jgi:hypothetical protein